MGRLTVVVGAQFGSEGKGGVAAKLAIEQHYTMPLTVVRVGGHNAGHSAVFEEQKIAFRTLPVAALFAPKFSTVVLGAGSEIALDVLEGELDTLFRLRPDVHVTISPQATLIEPEDYELERETRLIEKVGSTGKGVGSARSRRIWRSASTIDEVADQLEFENCSVDDINWLGGGDVLVEGNQGYGLGLHAGWYPFCTSTDCDPMTILAQAEICPWIFDEVHIWLVARTFPIRVAGNSGSLIFETSWDDLRQQYGDHIPTEYTTVTKKERRVGYWEPALVTQAIRAAGGYAMRIQDWTKVYLALTMLDYVSPKDAGVTKWKDLSITAQHHIEEYAGSVQYPISMVGTGPDTHAIRKFDG